MGEKPNFEMLVERHSRELFAYLWRLLGDEAEAEDCLQDVYLRAYKAYARLDDNANTRAWLYRIATNCAYTQLKKRSRIDGRSTEFIEGLASRAPSVDSQVEQSAQLAQIFQAVMALPHKQRAALMLRKYQELDYEQIALALDCSPASARANVYQALKKLRVGLAEEV